MQEALAVPLASQVEGHEAQAEAVRQGHGREAQQVYGGHEVVQPALVEDAHLSFHKTANC